MNNRETDGVGPYTRVTELFRFGMGPILVEEVRGRGLEVAFPPQEKNLKGRLGMRFFLWLS